MIIFDQTWFIVVTEIFGFRFFIIHSEKRLVNFLQKFASERTLKGTKVKKWYFFLFAKMTVFVKYGALGFARLMIPSFKNAFYSRIFVIIS